MTLGIIFFFGGFTLAIVTRTFGVLWGHYSHSACTTRTRVLAGGVLYAISAYVVWLGYWMMRGQG